MTPNQQPVPIIVEGFKDIATVLQSVMGKPVTTEAAYRWAGRINDDPMPVKKRVGDGRGGGTVFADRALLEEWGKRQMQRGTPYVRVSANRTRTK